MSEAATPAALLIVAVQDLFDGERAWAERLPAIAAKAGDGLARFLAQEPPRAAAQAERLRAIAAHRGAEPADAPNLWLRAILDDAERDTRTVAAGALRDIALAGAFRKAKQSERVSYETAIGLARACGDAPAADALTRSRDEEAAADAWLAPALAALLQSIE